METVWIGLWKSPQYFPSNCQDAECRREHWEWSDSGTTPVAYTNWAIREPNQDSSCARMKDDSFWFEYSCHNEFHYVCERAREGEFKTHFQIHVLEYLGSGFAIESLVHDPWKKFWFSFALCTREIQTYPPQRSHRKVRRFQIRNSSTI